MSKITRTARRRKIQSHQSEDRSEGREIVSRAHEGEHETKAKQSGQERGVLFCPRCGSFNIFWASGLPHLWSIWQCKDCGYRGAFIIKDGKLAGKVRENYEQRTAK
jgi:predicted RNA-binding Zn-ribbon protein involved in translation (DUF1610 family)